MNGKVIGVLLAILVLVVAGVVVLAVALGGDSGDDDADDGTPPLGTSAPGAGSSGEAGASDSPERVVEDYLEAAVAGDCAGAQELLVASDPTHCEERIASMDDPDVTLAGTEEQEAGVEVKVVYVIGDKEDSDYFTVEQHDGDWVIASVLSHEEKEAQEEGEESPDAGPSPEELAEELAKDAVQRWISVIDSGSCDRATEAATEEYAAQCERGVSTWHEGYELDDWRDSQTEVISSDVVEVGVYLSGRPGSDGSRGDIMRGYYVVVLEDGVWKVADSEIQVD